MWHSRCQFNDIMSLPWLQLLQSSSWSLRGERRYPRRGEGNAPWVPTHREGWGVNYIILHEVRGRAIVIWLLRVHLLKGSAEHFVTWRPNACRKEEEPQVNMRFWISGFKLFPLPDSFCGHSFVTQLTLPTSTWSYTQLSVKVSYGESGRQMPRYLLGICL